MTQEQLKEWLFSFAVEDRDRDRRPQEEAIDRVYPNGKKFTDSFFVFQEGQKVAICRHPRFTTGEYHMHSFVEILYIYSGNCVHLVEGKAMQMATGDVCMIAPEIYHLIEACDGIIINILVTREYLTSLYPVAEEEDNPLSEFLGGILYGTNRKKFRYMQCPPCVPMKALVEKMIEESVEYDRYSNPCLEAMIVQFFVWILRTCTGWQGEEGESCSKEERIVEILQYVQDHYRSVTMDELARRFNYTPTHLCRLFKRYTNSSFNRIVIDIKMYHACRLLRSTALPVQNIAYAVGYESVEYFHRIFKQVMKMTPLEYKKNPQVW